MGWAQAPVFSQLWGESGELWEPGGRLPDWSFAGYRFGEEPIPEVPVVANVTRFGARGDDELDDTEAFKRAIAEVGSSDRRGAIVIPAGRYLLSDILWIKKPGIVLRGEGPDATILTWTTELEDVRPNMGATSEGQATSNYSWSGGFIWFTGKRYESELAKVDGARRRGDRTLLLDRELAVAPGDVVEVVLRDDDEQTLLDHVYAGDTGDISRFGRRAVTRMVSRVDAVEGRRVTLERSLWLDVRPEWSPTISEFRRQVTEVGVERLAIEFPTKPYRGHFTERGMNAIAMNAVSHSWIRDVRIANCDSGIFLAGAFCTIDGLVFESDRTPDRQNTTGHHGVSLGRDCVMMNFDYRMRFIHDITVSALDSGNVIKNGRGVSLSLDHHKRAPFQNLFCNLDAGDGARLWKCGGGRKLGKHTGAGATFWGIRASTPMSWPRDSFGPDMMNLVGLTTDLPTVRGPRWFEAIDPDRLAPADLHAAQLRRRLGGE